MRSMIYSGDRSGMCKPFSDSRQPATPGVSPTPFVLMCEEQTDQQGHHMSSGTTQEPLFIVAHCQLDQFQAPQTGRPKKGRDYLEGLGSRSMAGNEVSDAAKARDGNVVLSSQKSSRLVQRLFLPAKGRR